MVNLDSKVFGKITIKEVIGSEPPLHPDMKEKLETEFSILVKGLKNKNPNELKEISEQQKLLEKLVNSRPGSMALSQSKIKLFTNYSQKYLNEISNRLHEN